MHRNGNPKSHKLSNMAESLPDYPILLRNSRRHFKNRFLIFFFYFFFFYFVKKVGLDTLCELTS